MLIACKKYFYLVGCFLRRMSSKPVKNKTPKDLLPYVARHTHKSRLKDMVETFRNLPKKQKREIYCKFYDQVKNMDHSSSLINAKLAWERVEKRIRANN